MEQCRKILLGHIHSGTVEGGRGNRRISWKVGFEIRVWVIGFGLCSKAGSCLKFSQSYFVALPRLLLANSACLGRCGDWVVQSLLRRCIGQSVSGWAQSGRASSNAPARLYSLGFTNSHSRAGGNTVDTLSETKPR